MAPSPVLGHFTPFNVIHTVAAYEQWPNKVYELEGGRGRAGYMNN